jgi:hypothetical protein
MFAPFGGDYLTRYPSLSADVPSPIVIDTHCCSRHIFVCCEAPRRVGKCDDNTSNPNFGGHLAVLWLYFGRLLAAPGAAGSQKGTKKQPKTSQMAETRTAMTAAAATIVAMSKLN